MKASNQKYRTPDNYITTDPERFTKPSLTVPNMALTIPEMLIRFSQGQPITGTPAANMIYSGEHFIPNMAAHDIIEQQQILKLHRERTEKLTKSYNEKMQQREQYKRQEQEEKKLFRDFMDNVDNDERANFYEYMQKRKDQKTPIKTNIETDKLKTLTT